MKDTTISDSIFYVGADDTTLDLFESQYIVPEGVSYNSYVIMDDKITIMDTVDQRATDEWIANVKNVLKDKTPAYLVVSHMEPDHAANIQKIAEMYPEMKIIGNAKTFSMMPQFFDFDLSDRSVVVKEGEEISLGAHTLQFFMAPMVHWPEVMVTYEKSEKILFSADGFGKFGALSVEADWACEARRYYFNIVGKYGAQVQALLKKAATLDIQMICPLHGPILKENLGYYIDKYNTWSSYEPEDEGVLVAYASIHGNTAKAAKKMGEILKEKGAKKVVVSDLSREDMAEVIEDAFRYDKIIVAAATYDGGIFPVMEDFLRHLKSKNYQKRVVGIMENGSWAPMAGKQMRAILDEMKNLTICDNQVTIRSTMNEKNVEEMTQLIRKYVEEGRSTPGKKSANDTGNSWEQIEIFMIPTYEQCGKGPGCQPIQPLLLRIAAIPDAAEVPADDDVILLGQVTLFGEGRRMEPTEIAVRITSYKDRHFFSSRSIHSKPCSNTTSESRKWTWMVSVSSTVIFRMICLTNSSSNSVYPAEHSFRLSHIC